jgi:hypothetical protein
LYNFKYIIRAIKLMGRTCNWDKGKRICKYIILSGNQKEKDHLKIWKEHGKIILNV